MVHMESTAPATRVGEPVRFSRTTRGGRVLHYELRVEQQPQRARACGSGPKSSADRRPVDPPPVVLMKVFCGPHYEDITFGYNADFFLYASLHPEHPEHDAPHRPNSHTQHGPAVLSGSPVSSMVLLDRPEEAGYFVFSDLSVRHEGRYFLNFALMEEVKEDADRDRDEHMSDADEITGPDLGGSQRSFQFRTEVNSDVFDVYSAKKFPGLQESTALSRAVAEQGCRVRIRRDIRMRRREKPGKGSKEIAAREDKTQERHQVDRTSAAILDRALSNLSEMANSWLSVPTSEPLPGSRQPPYNPMAPYPPHPPARSQPTSPSYLAPPQSVLHPPRPPCDPVCVPERSSPQQYGQQDPPTSPYHGGSRGSFLYRAADPIRGPPMWAPKLELADAEQKRDTLPSIHSIQGITSEPRGPLHNRPWLLPSPPAKREAEYVTLPPIPTGAYSLYRPPLPATAITPSTGSSSRKRSADEANLASVDDYRLQNGRRQQEQPLDANYVMDPRRQSTPCAQVITREALSIDVQREHQQPPSNWNMSSDEYNRASDNGIRVLFPNLHASRMGRSA